MAPPRSKPPPDDSRSEASSTKEKVGASNSAALNGKNRRVAGSATGGSSLRDVLTAGPSSAVVGNPNTAVADANPGVSKIPSNLTVVFLSDVVVQLQWSSFDPSVLHGYRYDYRLNTPTAFNKPYNQLVLSRSPIGKLSPTMARRKEERRQSKEQLANSVRKHFNSMGIIESEVVVDFLYKVRWQGESREPP